MRSHRRSPSMIESRLIEGAALRYGPNWRSSKRPGPSAESERPMQPRATLFNSIPMILHRCAHEGKYAPDDQETDRDER
jgi:hypothetical protein